VTPATTPCAAVLTGHVERLALFRDMLDDAEDDTEDGLPTVSGTYDGTPVVVVGTGMGGPVTVAGVRKVRARGAAVVVRAGGAGVVAKGVETGHLIVATAAVRDEGASSAFLPIERPAVADPAVVHCLSAAALRSTTPVHIGVVHSKDSFFASEVDIEGGPLRDRARQRWSAWQRLGVLASDMEVATLLAVAESYGMAAGAVLRINHLVKETGGLRPVEATLCAVALAGVGAALRSIEQED